MQPPQALALPSLPVLTLPNKAPALPISLRPSLLPWERPQHPGLLCSLRAMAILGCETLHQLGSFSEHFINIPAVGARPPPTLLASAHKQQLPITLLRAEIHARLHPDLLPRSSAGAGLVWTASQPQTLPRAHKHPTVTHIGTTPSSQPASLALTGRHDAAWGQALGHGGTQMMAPLAGLRKSPALLQLTQV